MRAEPGGDGVPAAASSRYGRGGTLTACPRHFV